MPELSQHTPCDIPLWSWRTTSTGSLCLSPTWLVMKNYERKEFFGSIYIVIYTRPTAIHSGDANKSRECVAKLRDLVTSGSMSDDLCHEVLYGRAGYLYALLYVGHLVPGAALDTQDLVEQQVSSLLEAGHRQAQSEASSCPLSFTWHGKHYLGAAHGLAGILTVLLQVLQCWQSLIIMYCYPHRCH